MGRWIAALLVLLAAGIALLVWMLRAPAPPAPARLRPPATATATPSPAATATPLLFHLSGVASGGDDQFAVIDDPEGVSGLYRLGESVSGLGTLARIEPFEVTLDTETGPVTLRLQPAPTRTASPPATQTPRPAKGKETGATRR
jgi:hypothetical protein